MLYRIFLVRAVYCHITDGMIGTRSLWRGSAGTIEDARRVIKDLRAQDRHDPSEDSFDVRDENGKAVIWWEPVFLAPVSPKLDIDDLDSIPF
jgi:hypothetical protein